MFSLLSKWFHFDKKKKNSIQTERSIDHLRTLNDFDSFRFFLFSLVSLVPFFCCFAASLDRLTIAHLTVITNRLLAWSWTYSRNIFTNILLQQQMHFFSFDFGLCFKFQMHSIIEMKSNGAENFKNFTQRQFYSLWIVENVCSLFEKSKLRSS